MKTVLLTGGAGFIGSHLADMYLQEGYKVVIVDDLSTGSRQHISSEAIFYQMDIQSPRLHEVFREHKPDLVNHHAAQINVRKSMEDPILDAKINLLGLLRLLEACAEYPPRHVIFASSGGAIYGEDVPIPTPEDALIHPISLYGLHKWVGEQYFHLFQERCGYALTILRYANVYGPRQNPLGEAGVISIFLSKLLRGEKPEIFGDGNQVRDYTYVSDVVEVNRRVSENALEGTFNVGTGVGTSVNDLARDIAHALGRDDFPFSYGPPREGELAVSILDAQKLLSVLPDFSFTPLQSGLQETIAYFREVWAG